MLKKTITYTDFNEKEVTEDFYFHLSKADLIELEVGQQGEGGMAAWLQKIVASNDGKAIINEFKKLILNSYGQKSPDGKRFIKSEALRDEFVSTEAYSTLFMELCTDADAAAAFVNGIVPTGLEEEVAKMRGAAQGPTEAGDETRKEVIEGTGQDVESKPDPTGLTTEPTPRVLTTNEMLEMDSNELKAGLASGQYKLS